MTNLVETSQYEDGIYQLETNDPVEGGLNGIDNLQAKQLANRTNWLKAQLVQATEAVLGFLKVGTQAQVDAGTNDSVAVTPLKLKNWVKQSTESVLGLLKVATQAQVDAGTDDTVAVTPKKLKAWVKQATESVLGLMKVGTQAQVDAGTADNVAVTPAKLRYGFAVSLTTNGYIAFPSWLAGLIIQWGTIVTSTTEQTYSYPIVFPTNTLNITISSSGTVTGQGEIQQAELTNNSTFVAANDTTGSRTARYFVVGY